MRLKSAGFVQKRQQAARTPYAVVTSKRPGLLPRVRRSGTPVQEGLFAVLDRPEPDIAEGYLAVIPLER